MPNTASIEWLDIHDDSLFSMPGQDGRRWWQTSERDTVSLQIYPGALKEGVDTSSPDALREMLRPKHPEGGLQLVDYRVVETDGITGVETVLRVPQSPSGMTYIGQILFPFPDFTFLFEAECRERGISGLREAVQTLKDVMRGAATMTDSGVEGGASHDDSAFDPIHPHHPLSRLRRLLHAIEAGLQVAPELGRFSQIPLPRGEKIDATRSPRGKELDLIEEALTSARTVSVLVSALTGSSQQDYPALARVAKMAATDHDALLAVVDHVPQPSIYGNPDNILAQRHVRRELVRDLALCVPGLVCILEASSELLTAANELAYDARLRMERVATLLGEIGMPGRIAVPTLIRAMHADPRGLGELAGAALGKIGGEEAVRELNRIWFSGWDRKLCESCHGALVELDEQAHAVLLSIVDEADPLERARALFSLEIAGYPQKDLAELALRMLKDPSALVVETATKIVGRFDEPARRRAKLVDVTRSYFFKWLHLLPEKRTPSPDTSESVLFRPSPSIFKNHLMVKADLDHDGWILRIRLGIARDLIEGVNMAYAADIAHSFLRAVCDSRDQRRIKLLLADLDAEMQRGTALAGGPKHEAPQARELSPGYSVYLGRRESWLMTLGTHSLKLSNNIDNDAAWFFIDLNSG